MKTLKYQLIIAFLLFSCSAPTQQIKHETPPSENLSVKVDKKVIAAQVLLFKSSTYEELEKEMAEMKASGVNIVIVRVFHNKIGRASCRERV